MNDTLFYKAAYLVQDFQSFDSWEYEGVGKAHNIPNLGTVTLIERQKDERYDQVAEYGEAPQGYEGEIGLIFQIDAPEGTVYVKKSGTKSSYGYESWDGKIVQVRPAEKTVTVFESV